MILEVVVSASLLAALMVILNQVVVQLHRQSEIIDRRVVAQQTLENLLEAFTARDWNQIDTESITALEAPDWVRAKLPKLRIAGEVVAESDPIEAKRVRLQFSWKDPVNMQQRPLALTTWIFRHEEVER